MTAQERTSAAGAGGEDDRAQESKKREDNFQNAQCRRTFHIRDASTEEAVSGRIACFWVQNSTLSTVTTAVNH